MISKILSGHHISGSWVTESPFFYFCPRPLGVRRLLDRWYLSCQQTAWMVLVISTGGSISSMHTLTSSLGLWDTPKSKTFIDLTERNLSYLYIIYILSVIPNCFQLCVAAEYKRGWEGQIRTGRDRADPWADPWADRQLDDNCWLTCCGCWLMESITLPTLIVIEAGACLDVGGVDLKNNINKKEFILSGWKIEFR